MSGYKLTYTGSKVQHLLNIVDAGVAPREHYHELATEEFSGFMSPEEKRALSQKIDGAYVENGYLYLTSGESIVAGPLGPFGSGGGGGGGGNEAKFSVKNLTGWLTNSVAEGSPCILNLEWSSIEDGISTGAGTLQVYVADALKTTLSIEQGLFGVDVSPWLINGNNAVKLTVTDVYGNNRTLKFNIELVSLSIKSTFDGNAIFTGDISYYYTPVGSAQKTVHFILDNKEIDTHVITLSNQQLDFIIPAQSHGAHSFEVYITANFGDSLIESNHLYYDLICVEDNNNTPIIASVFRQTEVEQFDTFIIPYRVYNPQDLTATITLEEKYGDQLTVLQELIVDRISQTWNHRFDKIGDYELYIRCGSVLKVFKMEAIISNITANPVTNNLALDLNPYGRSNLEQNPLIWENGGISCKFSGFNLKSDGWCLDDEGITVMRVGGDSRLVIPTKIFEKDIRATGKTIELEFSTRDVRNYESTIFSCMSDGRGLQVTSQMAMMASAQSNIGTQYKEGEHIRLSFVVEKRTSTKLLMVYLNGICSGAVAYPSDDDFVQSNAVEITVGSSDCFIDLYHIRIYNSDLTRQQILLNWVADTQLGSLKKARFLRNDIYDDYGNIIISKLPKDLPYLVLESIKLPQFKGDKVTISGYYVDPTDTDKSFRFVGAEIDVQGTSSQYYKVKNYKIKFKKGFIRNDGTVVSTYAMNDSSVPVMVFCMKADVASSEGANNVVSAKIFNSLSPKMPAQELDPRIRNTIDGHPIVIFWDKGNGPVFLGKYNFNNDKSTNEVFGLTNGDESWECKQNGTRGTAMKEANFTGNGWKQDWEARFPDENTDTTRLAAFVSWVASTNSEEATGETLLSPVTYGNVTYSYDSAEYRLDKFRYEIDQWAHKQQSLAYYLYTLIILAIDQREKNTFPTYIARAMLWFWLYYDGDSILGINNKGALTFSPFLEDTDYTEAGDPVFNGAAHVFWTNLRICFSDEIEKMYQDWRTSGLLSYEIMRDAFDDHQNKWPEAIFNEDMYKKCLEAWIEDGDGSYLPMLLGKKELQRAWWLFFRFRYLDSKFVTGTSMENRIMIRAHEQDNIRLVSYVPIYGNVFYNALQVQRRMLNTGEEYEFPWEASGAEDTVIGINDADLLTSLGDLSQLMIETIDLSKATHLTQLKLGNAAEDYKNKNLLSLTLGNNTLLKIVDVRNCPSLTQSVDMSGCTGLEEVYFDGTSIASLSLPNGGVLKKLHLPETIVNLTLQNQASLTEFEIPNYSQITTLVLENVSSVVNPLEILTQMPEKSRVRIIGFSLNVDDAYEAMDFFNKLNTMRGIDEAGNNVDTAQISGTVNIKVIHQSQLEQLRARYPYITFLYEEMLPDVSIELIQRTLSGVYRNDRITTVGSWAFGHSKVDSLSFPNAKTIGEAAFCNSAVSVLDIPSAEYVGARAFDSTKIKKLDLKSVTQISPFRTFAIKSLEALILRHTSVVLAAGTNMEIPKTCYIYVPKVLADGTDGVNAYKSASNWALYPDQFRAIEDYPEICGGE